MGAEMYAGMLIRKNRNVFGCRNNNYLSGFFFFKKSIFIPQLESFEHSCYFQVITYSS